MRIAYAVMSEVYKVSPQNLGATLFQASQKFHEAWSVLNARRY